MINHRYKILKTLGEGRSKVFLCEDKFNLHNKRAIKILDPDATIEDHYYFKEEFLTIRKFQNRNIVKADDYGTVLRIEGSNKNNITLRSSYYTLEYIDGNNLEDYCRETNNKYLEELMKQLCSVLFYLHESNYIYFDLKLENIIITEFNNEPILKIIDFGLTEYLTDDRKFEAKGTAHYMAPELLQNMDVDHRVDLYSLGVLLYKILFGKYPFDSNLEIEIYKQHLESEPVFPTNHRLVKIISKLLAKNPDERYKSALSVAQDITDELQIGIFNSWSPSKVFVINNAVFSIIKDYLFQEKTTGIICLSGISGSGKTSLSQEIFYNYKHGIIIENLPLGEVSQIWKVFLYNLIFNPEIYNRSEPELIQRALNVFDSKNETQLDEIKLIFFRLLRNKNIYIIFDDFNRYDLFTLDLLKEIIPVFIVNNVKVVITEDPNLGEESNVFASIKKTTLVPFTNTQIKAYLRKCFSPRFPHNKISELVSRYADFYPGVIENFLKDLFFLQILLLEDDTIRLTADESRLEKLKENQVKIHELRTKILNDGGLNAAGIISLFENVIPQGFLQLYFNISEDEAQVLINYLEDKNIISISSQGFVRIISLGLKNYLRENLSGVKEKHLLVAECLENNFPQFNAIEIGEHFNLGANIRKAYQIWSNESRKVSEASAYKTEYSLLALISKLDLDQETLTNNDFLLAQVLYNLGEFNKSQDIINNIDIELLKNDFKNDLMFIHANNLVHLGEYAEANDLFKNLLNVIEEPGKKNDIEAHISSILIYLNKHAEAEKSLKDILKSEFTEIKTKAYVLNHLARIEFLKGTSNKKNIEFLQSAKNIYEELRNINEVIRIENNLGVVNYTLNNLEETNTYYNNSLKHNQDVGNLYSESFVTMNIGIISFSRCDFDSAQTDYLKALNIFNNTGNRYGAGLVYSNLGELHLTVSEFSEAKINIEKARDEFKILKDGNEEIQASSYLAVLYSIIGDETKVQELSKSVYDTMNSNSSLQNIVLINNYLLNLLSEPLQLSQEELNEFQTMAITKKSFTFFLSGFYSYLDKLYEMKEYDQIVEELENESFTSTFDYNIICQAKKYLYKSMIADKITSYQEPIYYLEKSYELLSETKINELSWRVLLGLAENYFKRGLLNKTLEYSKLVKSIIDHIGNNIKNPKLQNKYFANKFRNDALLKISRWEKFIK